MFLESPQETLRFILPGEWGLSRTWWSSEILDYCWTNTFNIGENLSLYFRNMTDLKFDFALLSAVLRSRVFGGLLVPATGFQLSKRPFEFALNMGCSLSLPLAAKPSKMKN